MSIFSSVGNALKGALGGFVSSGGNPLGAIVGGAGALLGGSSKVSGSRGVMPGSGQMSMLPSMSRIGAGVGTAARVGSSVLRRVPGGIGTIATGVGAGMMLYDAFGNPVSRRRRRMNPMNARAARRAIRRIKGARKMLMQIERQLPKARTAQRRTTRNANPDFIQLRNS